MNASRFLIASTWILLTSCQSAINTSGLPSATALSSATAGVAATATFRPTSTPLPSPTSTPSLPITIELTFDTSIPEGARNQTAVTIDRAYWFYTALGCSPDGFKVNGRDNDIGGEASVGFAWIGIRNMESEPSVVETGISHEVAHVMCQLAFTGKNNMGAIDLRWLTEGVPNYFSAMEQITNTGMNSGVKLSSIGEHDRGMARWVSQNFCQIPLAKLEPANAHIVYSQGFGAIADVATRLLVKSNPDGVAAIIHYYTLLATTRKEDAFQQAFGISTVDFYQKYQTECINGFPTVTR
ncbi:MAG: hypothetical protein K8S20_15195 [Chloroflexi bacterium]|nr:hypothetical protein [Chloroflexota bacterium]